MKPEDTTPVQTNGASTSATAPAPKSNDPFSRLSSLETAVVPPLSATINLGELVLSQDFTAEVPVKELAAVTVRKPQKHEFVRVHPDPTYTLPTMVLRMRDERDEVFLVDRGLWSHLREELTPTQLALTVSRQGAAFLWPLRLPGPDGRFDAWGKTASDAARQAKTAWVRVFSDMSRGSYRVLVAEGHLGEPAWPSETFGELVNIAFGERFIADLTHPALLRLRGAV